MVAATAAVAAAAVVSVLDVVCRAAAVGWRLIEIKRVVLFRLQQKGAQGYTSVQFANNSTTKVAWECMHAYFSSMPIYPGQRGLVMCLVCCSWVQQLHCRDSMHFSVWSWCKGCWWPPAFAHQSICILSNVQVLSAGTCCLCS